MSIRFWGGRGNPGRPYCPNSKYLPSIPGEQRPCHWPCLYRLLRKTAVFLPFAPPGWLCKKMIEIGHKNVYPQHFLYFFPLPQGHGSLRPIFIDWTGLGGLSNFSRSEISSGLSGSMPIMNCHPFLSNMEAIYSPLCSFWTRTIAGFFSVPNFAMIKIRFLVSCNIQLDNRSIELRRVHTCGHEAWLNAK